MAKVMITQAKIEALADALRAKLGFTGKKTLAQLTQAVSDFDTGTDTSDATGGAAQMLQGYTAYGAGGKFTGSIQSLGAQTYQPSTSDQTIPAGKYLSGAQKIAKMVLQEKVVTLSTSQQVLTPPVGVHGFSKVTVPGASLFKSEISTAAPSAETATLNIATEITDVRMCWVYYDGDAAENAIRAVLWGQGMNFTGNVQGVAFYGPSGSISSSGVSGAVINGVFRLTPLYLSSLKFAPVIYHYAICGT